VGLVLTAGGMSICRIPGAELGEPGSWCGGAAGLFLGFPGPRSQRQGAGWRQLRRAEHSLRAGLVGPARATGLEMQGRAQGRESPGCRGVAIGAVLSRLIRSHPSERQATQTPVTPPASSRLDHRRTGSAMPCC
jgi:hypothetical protein